MSKSSIMYPPIQADDTGCVHSLHLDGGRWRCRHTHCLVWFEPVMVVKDAVELRAVVQAECVTEPVCGECGARHDDTDRMYQVRACVFDLEDGADGRSVARRMRVVLGMVG